MLCTARTLPTPPCVRATAAPLPLACKGRLPEPLAHPSCCLRRRCPGQKPSHLSFCNNTTARSQHALVPPVTRTSRAMPPPLRWSTAGRHHHHLETRGVKTLLRRRLPPCARLRSIVTAWRPNHNRPPRVGSEARRSSFCLG
jgi:hypothetical protein